MNKTLLSLVGVAALAAITTPAEARDYCGDSGYRGYSRGYHRSGHVVHAPRVYVRHYDRGYHHSHERSCAQPVRRVYYRSDDDGCRHGGVRGFIHRIFR